MLIQSLQWAAITIGVISCFIFFVFFMTLIFWYLAGQHKKGKK